MLEKDESEEDTSELLRINLSKTKTSIERFHYQERQEGGSELPGQV